jgi:hypothetical protein
MFANWKPRLAAMATVGILLSSVCVMAAPPRLPPAPDGGPLVVHEWGTFLSVQGSDGKTLGGMVDSEENLPRFVRERALDGRNRWCMYQKMETPVTYFYVDRPRTVQVRVGMPHGLLTHWYPAVRSFGPPLTSKLVPVSDGSFLDWGQVDLIPDTSASFVGPTLPATDFKPVGHDDTWRFARETDAAFVRKRVNIMSGPPMVIATKDGRLYTGNLVRGTDTELVLRDGAECDVTIPVAAIDEKVFLQNGSTAPIRSQGEREKFLFYRGLGSFDLPLHVRTVGAGNDVRLMLQNQSSEPIQGLFVIRVDKDTIEFAALPALAASGRWEGSLSSLLYARTSRCARVGPVSQVKEAVASALIQAGLYPKEAQAMVNTWEKSYFRTEGLRMLYVLPRRLVDDIIPIQIQPAPQQLQRVMVGRSELLTPDMERRLEKAVADLTVSNPSIRLAGAAVLAQLGRIREPALHRVAAMTTWPDVRHQAQTLIRTADLAPGPKAD